MSEAKRTLPYIISSVFIMLSIIVLMFTAIGKEEEANLTSADIQELSQKVDNLSQQIETANEEVKKMSGKVTDLQDQLDITTSELTRLQNAFKELGVDF